MPNENGRKTKPGDPTPLEVRGYASIRETVLTMVRAVGGIGDDAYAAGIAVARQQVHAARARGATGPEIAALDDEVKVLEYAGELRAKVLKLANNQAARSTIVR